jgi:replication factor A1
MNVSSIKYVEVKSLIPNLSNLNLIVKILKIGSPKLIRSRTSNKENLVAEAFVGDETGSILLTLWNEQIQKFNEKDVIEILKGYTTIYKGSLKLNVSQKGRIKKINKEIEKVNLKNNLSEKTQIRTPWRQMEFRPFKRRRRR